MALDFGMTGLFKNSEPVQTTTGDPSTGFVSAGSTGSSSITRIGGNRYNSAGGQMTTLETINIAAGTFENRDQIIIICHTDSTGTTDGRVAINITGTGLTEATLDIATNIGGDQRTYIKFLFADVDNTSNAQLFGFGVEDGGASANAQQTTSAIGTNWFQGAWTLKLQSGNGGAGTVDSHWTVLKVKNS